MWKYYLVEEIIMNQNWIEKNGDNWIAGRVECFDLNSGYGYSDREYPLIIDIKDWVKFDKYLGSIKTNDLKTLEELITMSKLSIVRFKL